MINRAGLIVVKTGPAGIARGFICLALITDDIAGVFNAGTAGRLLDAGLVAISLAVTAIKRWRHAARDQ